jgi:hypothetical protein
MPDDEVRRSAANGAGPTRAPGLVVLSSLRDDGELLLVMRGGVEGRSLVAFGDALEVALSSGSPCIHVDLAGVHTWSLLAQAMVLTTARRLALRGSVLVLHRMGPALRAQSQALGVAQRVVTTESDGFPNG